MVLPMKEDLTNVGFEQLIDSESVDQFLTQESGTLLVVVNSVCGCAAGNMRPGVKLSLQHSKTGDSYNSFCRSRYRCCKSSKEIFLPYPPSSPSIALFKDGKLVHFLERHHIEGGSAQMIAANLAAAYDAYC